MSNFFDEVMRESLENKVPNVDFEVTDEESFRKAFSFVVSTIGLMSKLFLDISDITNYKALFESVNIDDEFNSTVENIKGCGDKVHRVCGMIYEYLMKGTLSANDHEKIFNPMRAPAAVNRHTHQAQTAVRDYDGDESIEIPCQVYDETVNEFNSSISVLNQERGPRPFAEHSNLVSLNLSK